MKQTLQNQTLAIETFQHKGGLAGQEPQSFAQCTRNNSEDFVRCKLAAVQHFESSLQKEHDTQIHARMHALQDECRDHVAGEELKTRAELQHAPEHESALCRQSAQTLEASLNQRVRESLRDSTEREQLFLTEAQKKLLL